MAGQAMGYYAWLLLVVAKHILLSKCLKLSTEVPGPGSVVEASDGCLYQLISALPENYTADEAPAAVALLSQVTFPRKGYEEQAGLLRESMDTYRALMVDLDGQPCKPSLRAHLIPRTARVASNASHPAVVSNHTSNTVLRFQKLQHELEEQGLKVAQLAHDNATKDAFRGMLARAKDGSAENSLGNSTAKPIADASNSEQNTTSNLGNSSAQAIANASNRDQNRANSLGNSSAKAIANASNNTIEGALHMAVIDPETFSKDPSCRDAIRIAVSKKMHVPLEWVSATLVPEGNDTEPDAKNSSLLQQQQEPSSIKSRVTASFEISVPGGIYADLEAWRKDATAASFHEELSQQFRQAALNGDIHRPQTPDVVKLSLNIQKPAFPPSPLTKQKKAPEKSASQVATAADKGLKPWTHAMVSAAKVRDEHAARGNTLAKAALSAEDNGQGLEAQAREWDALPGAAAKLQARKLRKKAKHFIATATDADKKAKDSFKIAKSIDDSLPAYERRAEQDAYHEMAMVAPDVQAPLPPLALTQNKAASM